MLILFFFFLIQELAEIHDRFLDKLKEAISPNPKYKLSQIFLEFREPFLIYGEYCSNVTNATDTLLEVTKKISSLDQLVQVKKIIKMMKYLFVLNLFIF